MDGLDLASLAPADRSMAIMDVCDRAILQLGEARTIEEVRRVGDMAAAFAAYTRKIKAALEAQNATNLVVALAEARIGAELKAAQERGELEGRGGSRGNQHTGGIVRAPDIAAPTLSDLGIPRQRASEMKKLADFGPENIRDLAEEATAAEVPLSRSLTLAASDAVTAHVSAATAKGEPVTERTIRAAIRSVLPAREPRRPVERITPEERRLPDEWTDLLGAIETIAGIDWDLPDLWRRTPHGLRQKLRDEARCALPKMAEWVKLTEATYDTQ